MAGVGDRVGMGGIGKNQPKREKRKEQEKGGLAGGGGRGSRERVSCRKGGTRETDRGRISPSTVPVASHLSISSRREGSPLTGSRDDYYLRLHSHCQSTFDCVRKTVTASTGTLTPPFSLSPSLPQLDFTVTAIDVVER